MWPSAWRSCKRSVISCRISLRAVVSLHTFWVKRLIASLLSLYQIGIHVWQTRVEKRGKFQVLKTLALIVSAHTAHVNSHATSCIERALRRCLDLTILDVRRPPLFFWWIIFSTDFLRLAKKWRKSIDKKFEFIAKCTIEYRAVLLFVYLCDDFKCLLKG